MDFTAYQMEGFGSSDITTPFSYGSVNEATTDKDKLETKVKKKFWKTKQKIVEKLGREQDHFVVRGDSEIDAYIESAKRLQKSCEQLINILQKHISSLQEISHVEEQMGHFLLASSNTEYTSSSGAMEKTGKLMCSMSTKRIQIVPSLHQLQHDLGVFLVSAVKDLSKSIEHLEKARSEYRAAMLWLRNASTKLDDPDASKQLNKFREAQTQVKQTKEHYEKLKDDVTEKISMLNASRCSLLSRSLPHYQEATLTFWENTSQELHTVLDEFSSTHLHQYRIKCDTDEEISEETKSPSSDSDDDPENTRQLLLDLASTEDIQMSLTDQVLTKDSSGTQDSTGDINSSYQNVDSFDQLKELLKKESSNTQTTPEASSVATLQPVSSSSDQDLMKYLVTTSTMTVQSSTDTMSVNLASLKVDTASLTSVATTVAATPITSHLSPVTSHTSPVTSHPSGRAPVTSRKSFTTGSHDHGLHKHQDNWDDLFAELDPLSNEKV
ncbi:islet cell autoantigen 1-like protein isoform X2 [Dysidea avara]